MKIKLDKQTFQDGKREVSFLSEYHIAVLYTGLALTYLATIISVGSGINYVIKNRQVLK